MRTPSPALSRATAALAVAALVVAGVSGCFATPPTDEQVTVSLETADGTPVELAAVLPGGAVDAGPVSPSSCVDDAQAWELPSIDDSIISFATVSAATACPDERPVNGRFPSWTDAASLPDHAVPIDVPGVPAAHRFSLRYTECTNFCTDWMRELALLELDGATVLVAGTGPSAERFDELLASIEVR